MPRHAAGERAAVAARATTPASAASAATTTTMPTTARLTRSRATSRASAPGCRAAPPRRAARRASASVAPTIRPAAGNRSTSDSATPSSPATATAHGEQRPAAAPHRLQQARRRSVASAMRPKPVSTDGPLVSEPKAPVSTHEQHGQRGGGRRRAGPTAPSSTRSARPGRVARVRAGHGHAGQRARDDLLEAPQVIAAPEARHRRGQERERGHGADGPVDRRVRDQQRAEAGADHRRGHRPAACAPAAAARSAAGTRSASDHAHRRRRRRDRDDGQRRDARRASRPVAPITSTRVGRRPVPPDQHRAAGPGQRQQRGHGAAQAHGQREAADEHARGRAASSRPWRRRWARPCGRPR